LSGLLTQTFKVINGFYTMLRTIAQR